MHYKGASIINQIDCLITCKPIIAIGIGIVSSNNDWFTVFVDIMICQSPIVATAYCAFRPWRINISLLVSIQHVQGHWKLIEEKSRNV